MKTKTVDEFCGVAPGSMDKFMAKKKEYIKKMQKNKKDRIQSARAPRDLAWAA